MTDTANSNPPESAETDNDKVTIGPSAGNREVLELLVSTM